MEQNLATTGITIEIFPLDGEEDQMQTKGALGEVALAVKREFANQHGYRIENLPNDSVTRGGDLIFTLLWDVSKVVYDNQVFLLSLVSSAVSVITLLNQHRRVEQVELIDNDRKIVIKGSDRSQIEPLVRQFLVDERPQPLTPDKARQVTVRPRVSTRKRRKS